MGSGMISLLKEDSVKWIGSFPPEWKEYRIKDICNISPSYSAGKPDEYEICTVLPMESVSENGKINADNIQLFLDISDGLTLIEQGDVIFAKITPCMENGKGAYIENIQTRYAFGSTEFHTLRPSTLILGKFLYYYTHNEQYRKYAEVNMTGAAGQKRVSTRFIKFTKIYLPPVQEQEKIVAYLELALKNINNVIKKKRKQIEKLEETKKSVIFKAVTRGVDNSVDLMYSGNELIGDIPQHWKVDRVKNIVKTKITDGPHETPELVQEGIPFISAEAIKKNKIDLSKKRGYITHELHEKYSKKCKPEKHDIFIIKSGATTGNVAYVDTDIEFNIWSPLAVVRCNEKLAYYKFIFFQFLSDVFRKQVELSWSFGTQENIGMGVIERLRITLPPLEEQKNIAKYLEEAVGNIEKAQNIIEVQIEKLIEYKNLLIHEYVTGKRRVTKEDITKGV